jgi:hypothetical protein
MIKKLLFAIGILVTSSILTFTCFYTHKSYYQRIPVTFSTSNIPLIEAEIEGKRYRLALDLGSKFQLSLYRELLTEIPKKNNGVSKWKDFRGNSYEGTSYFIPKIKIGNLTLSNIVANEESDDFIANVTIWNNTGITREKLKSGDIGRPILEKFNLLLNFQDAEIIACNNPQKLKKLGFDLSEMEKMPLEEGRGLIIKVNTDLGMKNIDFDTGATKSVLRSSNVEGQEELEEQYGMKKFTTSKLVIGNKDFGETLFYLCEITPELHEIDGMLGMDFLKKHVVYFDYPNRVVYIGESK